MLQRRLRASCSSSTSSRSSTSVRHSSCRDLSSCWQAQHHQRRAPRFSVAARAADGGAGASGEGSAGGDAASSTTTSTTTTAPPQADGGSAGSSNAVAARIAAAKAYRAASGGGGSGAAAAPPPPPPADSSEQADAAQQQAQYEQQLRQQQQELAAQASAYNQLLQQQQQQQQAANSLEQLAASDPGLPSPPGTSPARSDFYTSADAPGTQQLLSTTPRRPGQGSADEAADWLKGVLATPPGAAGAPPAIDPNLRAEEFTSRKEAASKQRGAEIITAFPGDFDQQQQQQQQQQPGSSSEDGQAGSSSSSSEGQAAARGDDASGNEDGGYQPRVTTWGVFPRPSNISAAYGGGRNIRPGQDLETADQKAEREAKYAAALAAYKKAAAIDTISDEELRAAQKTYDAGMQLFRRGRIDEALVYFDEARAAVPLKCKLGGLATLQAAVCYDTLGNSRQAEALYKRIRGHPTTEVSKKARQLVFGFQAMSFLKTENLSYAVKKEDYLEYFRRSADRTRVYVASPEEQAADAAEARRAAAVAAGVVLGPVLIMGSLLLSTK